MTVLESSVEKDLLRKCRAAGMLCLKFVSPARTGVPDRVIICPAGTIFIELKRPGEDLRPDQRAMHAKMTRYGAEIHTVSTFAGVAALVKSLSDRSNLASDASAS